MSTDGLIGSGTPVGRPNMAGAEKTDSADDQPILIQLRKDFDAASQFEQEDRDNYIRDTRFSASADQWDEEVKKRRGLKRPAMTFNMMNLVVKQIIGDYRQNKLSISVTPSGGQATEDKADIIAGLIRNIERESCADQAYTNALECAVRGNLGYIRIIPQYESDDVFYQKLVISPVHNRLTVYCDPMARLATRADARFYIITEMMDKTDFGRQYPKANPGSWDLEGANESLNGWATDTQIRLAEYYCKETVKARLAQFDNGAVVQIENDDELKALESIGWNVVKEREAERTNIIWRKCTGAEILEERAYRVKYIPIIPVLGEEVNLEGKPRLRSAIYYSHDAQKSYNYERSTAVERNALSAKAPWKVTRKEIEHDRESWDNANTTPLPYLVFTPDNAHPQGPERIEPPAPATAEISAAQTAALDFQRTTGVFNSQIGEQSNIQSGVGLGEQQSQGTTSTFIFPDNLRTGIEHCGRVLIDWIPLFYDTERVIRTISSEEDVEMQTINQRQVNPVLGVTEILNDITVGEYDIAVTAGKAFASRRREAVDGMMKFAQAFPAQAPLISDLMIKNMDVPGGDVMADRIKRSLPPQVVNDPSSPEGQQAAAAAQAQQQKAEALQQQLVEGKMQVEQGKNQAQMAKAQAEVVKAGAEVTKAKADTIQAVAQTHQKAAEHAVAMLDAARTGQPAAQQNMAQPVSSQQPAQPIPQQPAQAAPQPSQPLVLLGRHPDDAARDQQRDANTELLKQGVGAIAQHLMASQAAQQQRDAVTHQILAHIAGGNQAIGQHLAQSHQEMGRHMAENHKALSESHHAMGRHLANSHEMLAKAIENQNKIASAPTEAIRDKTGRITGSRKVV